MDEGVTGSTLLPAGREDVVEEAREQLQRSWQGDKDNRIEAMRDLRFLANDQWPEDVRRQRELDGRPVLTINDLPQFLNQVTNDIRQADLSIKVSPVDNTSDPDIAKIYNGLIRQIQRKSSASAVYGTSVNHQCGCGIGWFEITTGYCDSMSFDQEILIKSIPYPLAVYDDPDAIELDRSDAMNRNITFMITREAFEKKYPDAKTDSFSRPSDGGDWLPWAANNKIRISRYWRKVPKKKTIGMLSNGYVVETTGMAREIKQAIGVVQERQVASHRVEMFIVSGAEVLEGPFHWAGEYLPQVPVVGSEIPLEHGIYRHGVIRMARDPAQLYNFAQSAIAEHIGQAPKAPYKANPKSISKYKQVWDSANLENRPYLPYDPQFNGDQGPTRERPPDMPVALIQQAETAANDKKKTTGIYDASLGAPSNEKSGVAIARKQAEGDKANYHYSDNFKRSLEYAGRVIIDLIPKIYDNERVIRILGDDDAEDFVPINQVLYERNGKPIVVNDLSTARFDVAVTIGPSQMTKRIEQVQFMIEFMNMLDPAQRLAVSDLLAGAQDWEGAEEIAKRFKNMIQAQMPNILVDPEDPNAPPPPDPLDDPMVQAELQEKQGKARKSNADADKTEIENAMLVGQAESGYHPTQQPPGPPAPPKGLR